MTEKLLNFIMMGQVHEVGRPEDLKCIIEGKERLQKKLLIPEVLHLEPCRGIYLWEENIVDMNDNAGAKSRQHLKVLIAHVIPDCNNMTGIDEEDVVLAEGREQIS